MNLTDYHKKKHKIKHNWVGMVTHWELCKRVKFDYSTKCYVYLQTRICP